MAKPRSHREVLGSEEALGSILFVFFIPSKTKDGEPLPAGQDQKLWADAAGEMLTEQFDGATEMPPIETALINGEVAFRQHSGGHTTGPNWQTFLTFASRYISPRPR